MYYVAFFIYEPHFFAKLIAELINQDFSDVWIHHNQQDFHLDSLENLPILSDSLPWFPQPWYLYGNQPHECLDQTFPGLPLLSGTSLKAINNLLEWFAKHYSWSIFTWGGVYPLLSFAFISKEKALFDRFFSITSGVTNLLTNQQKKMDDLIVNSLNNKRISSFSPTYKDNCLARDNLLISSYNVLKNFSDSIQILLFSVFENPGERIWNACECDIQSPWLITSGYHGNNNSIVFNYNYLQSFQSNDELFNDANYKGFNFCDDEIDEICIIEYPIKVIKINPDTSNFIQSFASEKLAVLQPKTKEAFNNFCKDHITSQQDVLFVVPQGVNLIKLVNLIAKIERQDSMNYDFEYINEILITAQWFYGVNRDYHDTRYSLFLSNNNELIKNIDSLIVNDDYCLISCL